MCVYRWTLLRLELEHVPLHLPGSRYNLHCHWLVIKTYKSDSEFQQDQTHVRSDCVLPGNVVTSTNKQIANACRWQVADLCQSRHCGTAEVQPRGTTLGIRSRMTIMALCKC